MLVVMLAILPILAGIWLVFTEIGYYSKKPEKSSSEED
jgi:hypothetical protein